MKLLNKIKNRLNLELAYIDADESYCFMNDVKFPKLKATISHICWMIYWFLIGHIIDGYFGANAGSRCCECYSKYVKHKI